MPKDPFGGGGLKSEVGVFAWIVTKIFRNDLYVFGKNNNIPIDFHDDRYTWRGSGDQNLAKKVDVNFLAFKYRQTFEVMFLVKLCQTMLRAYASAS